MHQRHVFLLKLGKDSGCSDKDFFSWLEEICDQCDTCQKYKRAPLNPVVGLPVANRFNQCVAVDLKAFDHNKIWILHLIDAATCFSAASLITTKKREVVVTQIFRIWISYFGAPKKFFSVEINLRNKKNG